MSDIFNRVRGGGVGGSKGLFREKTMVLELIHSDGRRVNALELAQKARRLCSRAGIGCPMVREIVGLIKASNNDEGRTLLKLKGKDDG